MSRSLPSCTIIHHFYHLLLLIISIHVPVSAGMSVNKISVSAASSASIHLTVTVVDIEDICNTFRSTDIKKKPETIKYSFNKGEVDVIRKGLLYFYDSKRRLLPWRGDSVDGIAPPPRTAYGTWVSEIMLQQTRVETVISYWNRWMNRFNNVEALASATPDEVNTVWAGLGYYRRAQNLLKGAQKVVNDYNGVIPEDLKSLLSIPGVGPYTAGAISSIAYNLPNPLVDGNVIRVLSRLRAMKLEQGNSAMDKQCWSLAQEIVDIDRPGDFNQALMELGATICKPTSPMCDVCPVSSVCHANLLVEHNNKKNVVDANLPTDVTYFPRKVDKKKAKEVVVSICVLASMCHDSATTATGSDSKRAATAIDAYRFLFVRRPHQGLLANQWEFPTIIVSEESATTSVVDGDDNDDSASKCDDASDMPAEIHTASFKKFFKEHANIDWITLDDLSKKHNSCTSTSVQAIQLQQTMKLEQPIVHVFSHQRHTMHVNIAIVDLIFTNNDAGGYEVVSLLDDDNKAETDECMNKDSGVGNSTARKCKWMTAEEIKQLGLTTGVKNVLGTVTEKLGCSGASTKAPKKQKKSPATAATSTTASGSKLIQTKLNFLKK